MTRSELKEKILRDDRVDTGAYINSILDDVLDATLEALIAECPVSCTVEHCTSFGHIAERRARRRLSDLLPR